MFHRRLMLAGAAAVPGAMPGTAATDVVTADLPVPGKDFPFGISQVAQAAGDLRALGGSSSSGRPIVRLHLTDRAAGLAQLLEAVQ